MNEFQNIRVTVVVKNTKGKIYTLNYSTPQAMCEYLPREFEDNDLVIMMVESAIRLYGPLLVLTKTSLLMT